MCINRQMKFPKEVNKVASCADVVTVKDFLVKGTELDKTLLVVLFLISHGHFH